MFRSDATCPPDICEFDKAGLCRKCKLRRGPGRLTLQYIELTRAMRAGYEVAPDALGIDEWVALSVVSDKLYPRRF